MITPEKPDFEKLAAAHVISLYGRCEPFDHPDHLRIDSFKAGCRELWTSHVLPLQKEIIHLRNMIETGGEVYSDDLNDLRNQLSSKDKDLSELAGEYGRALKEIKELKQRG